MLDLSNITLMAIDCVNPRRTALAMRFSCRFVRFKDVVLYTDTIRDPSLPHDFAVRLVHTSESDEKRAPFAGHAPIPVDYERDAILLPNEEGGDILFMEWDSAILNPWAWDPSWLEYDYIGAPWPRHHDPGWPPCNETNNVGNGGFSFRSARFNKSVSDLWHGSRGSDLLQKLSSDRWFCRTARKQLESVGVSFAPECAAARFSCENAIYSGQFGYHGKSTVALNGWSGQMFDEVKKGQNPLI